MKDLRFKLTTECGYHWRVGQMHYWDGWYKPRLLTIDETGEHIGVAIGPVMFFWRFM